MEKIDIKEAQRIAGLSRLSLTDEEERTFGSQLSRIIEYMGTLNRLQTKDISATSHVIELNNVYRSDEPRPSLPPGEALENAPEKSEGLYRVPKIIE
jgi:aspartyl-tRNA(Asn)/glutamyl-tRNA(Gln) amidotransferase subunit C